MKAIVHPTRGERNNNPGNMEKGPSWAGLAPDQSGDTRFAVFVSADYGIRAMGRQLQTYQSRGIDTLYKIIRTWCPSADPGNGETVTENYLAKVCGVTGFSPNQKLDLHDGPTLSLIIGAMIDVEQGRNSYAGTDLFERGIQLALA